MHLLSLTYVFFFLLLFIAIAFINYLLNVHAPAEH